LQVSAQRSPHYLREGFIAPYVSVALTKGVNLTWLSEQTGVADATLHKHYGKFIHADARDALELAKIDSAPRLLLEALEEEEKDSGFLGKLPDRTGFEPAVPLR
jgi:hypothetical protein